MENKKLRQKVINIANWARENHLITPIENDPEKWTINDEWVKAIENLDEREIQILNEEAITEDDLIRGMAMIGFIKWDPWNKGVNEREIDMAIQVFMVFYKRGLDDRLKQFSARLRLRRL